MFKRYYNILTETEQKKCLEILDGITWKFGNKSTDDDNYSFWYKQLTNEDFFCDLFFKRIISITEKKFIISRILANGQTYGLPGSFHKDDEDDKIFTFLYYANPYWNLEWGGSTVFCKNQNEFATAEFIPNTGILFKSNLIHVGLEPTRHFNGLRVTIAYKLKEIN